MTAGRHTLAALALIPFLAACGGGGGGGGSTGPTATVSCSTTGAALADQVRLTCGAVRGDIVTVRAVIGGPSTSSDIYEVLFDLVFDDSLFEFVSGSVTEGPLLRQGGTTIAAAALAGGDPSRVVVSISLSGAVSGVSAGAGEPVILSLDFKGIGPMGGTGPRFENAQVIDSKGMVIGSITFLDNLMLMAL